MAFIPTTNCAKVAIEYLWEGQNCVMTLWFTRSFQPDQAALDALAQYIGTNFVNMLIPSQASNCTFERCTATRQESANDIQGVFIPSVPVPGTGGLVSVPLNCSWVFTHVTTLRGRSFRGRTYPPGLTETILTSAGQGDSIILGGIAAGYLQWLITNPPPAWVWSVVSHFADHLPRAAGLATPIIQVAFDTLLDSQRRRLMGRGS